jgi:hypothetical protein
VCVYVCTYKFFSWLDSPNRSRHPQGWGFKITLRHTTMVRRRDFYLTTQNTLKGRHPYTPWDSNPQSQQANGCRPTFHTARPQMLASIGLYILRSGIYKIWSNRFLFHRVYSSTILHGVIHQTSVTYISLFVLCQNFRPSESVSVYRSTNNNLCTTADEVSLVSCLQGCGVATQKFRLRLRLLDF